MLKEKDTMILIKEKEHQNELLLLKTQLLEQQLSQLSQVAKPKTSIKSIKSVDL